MGSIKKQPKCVKYWNMLAIKGLYLDISDWFWLFGRSKYIFIPSVLLVFCIAMDIYSKRMSNCKKVSWLDSFKEAPLLKGVLMEVGSPLVLYLLFLGWDIMEKNAFLSWFLICVSLLYYMVMIAFFVIVRRRLNHPSYRRKR